VLPHCQCCRRRRTGEDLLKIVSAPGPPSFPPRLCIADFRLPLKSTPWYSWWYYNQNNGYKSCSEWFMIKRIIVLLLKSAPQITRNNLFIPVSCVYHNKHYVFCVSKTLRLVFIINTVSCVCDKHCLVFIINIMYCVYHKHCVLCLSWT